MKQLSEHHFWIGASTVGPGTPALGIRRLTVDAVSGRPALGPEVSAGESPMFLAHIPNGMAVVHQVAAGAVSTMTIEGESLAACAHAASTGGSDPCHVAISPDQSAVFVTNFSGGSLTVHPLTAKGVGPASVVVSYPSQGRRVGGQKRSHPHQAVVDAERGALFVPDLGTDTIHVHSIQGLLAGDTGHKDLHTATDAGPRHLIVDGNHLLVANELDRTVTVIDIGNGQTVASAPATRSPGATTDPGTSAIRLTRTGLIVVGNRGPGTVGVLAWDREGPTLTFLGEYSCGGSHPRDLEITPDHRFVLVANQWSDQLAILRLDADEGTLTTVAVADTPSPACVLSAETNGRL